VLSPVRKPPIWRYRYGPQAFTDTYHCSYFKSWPFYQTTLTRAIPNPIKRLPIWRYNYGLRVFTGIYYCSHSRS
jgi:hypothetical protein